MDHIISCVPSVVCCCLERLHVMREQTEKKTSCVPGPLARSEATVRSRGRPDPGEPQSRSPRDETCPSSHPRWWHAPLDRPLGHRRAAWLLVKRRRVPRPELFDLSSAGASLLSSCAQRQLCSVGWAQWLALLRGEALESALTGRVIVILSLAAGQFKKHGLDTYVYIIGL